MASDVRGSAADESALAKAAPDCDGGTAMSNDTDIAHESTLAHVTAAADAALCTFQRASRTAA